MRLRGNSRRQEGKTLQGKEERYGTLFQNLAQGVIYQSADGSVIAANPAAERILGLSLYQMQGRPCGEPLWRAIREDESVFAAEEYPSVVALATGKEVEDVVMGILDSSGGYRWMRVCAFPQFKMGEDKPSQACTILEDITGGKRAEEALKTSEAWYSAFANQGIFGIVIVQDGVIRYTNQAHADICGYSVKELVGQTFLETVAPESREDAMGRYEARLGGGEVPPIHDITILRKDGTKRYVIVSGALTEYEGKPAVMAIVRDVTSVREAKEALRESEQKFRALFEAANDGMISVDPQTRRFSDANRQMVQMLGYESEEDITALTVEDIHPASDLPFVLEEFGRHVSRQVSRSENIPVQRRDGSVFYASISSSPVMIAGRTLLLCIFRDITERKRAEEALRLSELRFRAQFQGDPTAIVIWQKKDGDLVLTDLNKAAEAMAGGRAAGLIGVKAKELYKSRQDIMQLISQCITEKRTMVEEIISVNFSPGRDLIVAFTFAPPDMVIAHMEDITERKRAEDALRESEEKFRLLTEQSLLAICILQDGVYKYVNQAYCNMSGYSLEEINGWKPYEFAKTVHPEDLEFVMDQAKRKQEGDPGVVTQYIFRGIPKSGEVGWLELYSKTILYQGRPADLVMFASITQRKRAEEALRASEANYRAIFDTANDAIFVHDADTGAILNVNRKMTEMYGYTPEEALQVRVETLSAGEPPYTQEDALRWIKKAAEGEAQLFEWKAKDKAGRIFWVEVNLKRVTLGGKDRLMAIVRDITDRKRAEEQLKTSLKEKDALLRELYHRTKNNMQVISSLLSLQAAYTKDERLTSAFRDTEARIEAMALVHQKLYQSQNLSQVDLREYLNDLADLLMKSYGVSSSRIALYPDIDREWVLIDIAIPCGLVVNELLSNSLKHAFPGERRGEIRLQLHRVAEGTLELEVADNGVGVPPTFDFRKSDSLGLQTVVNIVEHQLQGSLRFEVHDGVSCNIRFKDDLYRERI